MVNITLIFQSGFGKYNKDITISGMRFTTKDQDNDWRAQNNCAVDFSGGWWYKGYYDINFNGVYSKTEDVDYYTGIKWISWIGNFKSPKSCLMVIR